MRAAMKTRGTPQGSPGPWKPQGGYRPIPTARLAAAWTLRAEGAVDAADLRAWFAAMEMDSRRGPAPADVPRRFGVEELAKLAGLTPVRARRALRRLAAARLLDWSEGALGFPDPMRDASPGRREAFRARLALFPRPGGRIPVPRRILRLLARGVRPALAATILGCLARCARAVGGIVQDRGRVKASWIAEAFGASERRVKEARGELADAGWLAPLEADQSALNRWGMHLRVDLDWSPPAGFGRAKSSPPPTDPGPKSSPPLPNPEPLRERKNQETLPGVRTGLFDDRPRRDDPGKMRPGPTPTPVAPPPPRPEVPDLRDVRREDLDDVGRTLALYDQAVKEGRAAASEWGRLRFLALAEHARSVGRSNPCGLFARLVRDGLWGYATQADEDEASRRLRRHLAGPPPTPPPSPALRFAPHRPSPSAAPGGRPPSEDARVVQELTRAVAARGLKIDPFLLIRRVDAAWTRARWDRAAAELSPRRPRAVGPSAPPPRDRRGLDLRGAEGPTVPGAEVPRARGARAPGCRSAEGPRA